MVNNTTPEQDITQVLKEYAPDLSDDTIRAANKAIRAALAERIARYAATTTAVCIKRGHPRSRAATTTTRAKACPKCDDTIRGALQIGALIDPVNA